MVARLVDGQLVLHADVGEGAAGHDAVVAAAGAEGVVEGFGDVVVIQIHRGGRAALDGAGG